MRRIRVWCGKLEFPLDAKAGVHERLGQTGAVLVVRDQNDISTGKSLFGQAFCEQIFHDPPMHNQRYQPKYCEDDAGAARDLAPDLQREQGAGEQKEHGRPGRAHRAHLARQHQQCSRLIHSANFHQQDEQRRDENCRAETFADVVCRAHVLQMIEQAGKEAGHGDDRDVGRNRQRFDRIIMYRPFASVALPFGQNASRNAVRANGLGLFDKIYGTLSV